MLQPKVEIMMPIGHDHRAQARKDRFERRRGDAIRRRLLNRLERQRDQIRDVGEQIQRDDDHVPSASASGMFRRGSFTSPAVNVMLFHASAEKSEPTCATHSAMNMP